MNSFDDLWIDPPRGVLEAAMYEAADALHRDLEGEPGSADLARLDICKRRHLEALWNAIELEPTGHREWQIRSQRWRFSTQASLLAIWWRDHLGRRHVRILGGCAHKAAKLPMPGPTRPALACVYPDRAVFVSQHRRARLFVVCGCGAWGTPEELAWMGPCCGPCFDRGIDESAPSLGWRVSPESVVRLVIAPDGERVATLDSHGVVEVRDLAGGRLLASRRCHPHPAALAWSPDGRWVTSGSQWERGEARGEEDIEWYHPRGHPFAFHGPSGGVVVNRSDGERLIVETIESWDLVCRLTASRPVRIEALVASPDGRVVAGASPDGLLLWDFHSARPAACVPLGNCLGPIAFSPDGKLLATRV